MAPPEDDDDDAPTIPKVTDKPLPYHRMNAALDKAICDVKALKKQIKKLKKKKKKWKNK